MDHRVRQRDEHAIAEVAALDARLPAHAGTPLIRTGRRVARLARGLAFPSNGVDIRAPAKQPAEQRHLLSGGQPGRFRLARDKDGRLQGPPLDAVRLGQRDQPRVLGLQRSKFIAIWHRLRTWRPDHACRRRRHSPGWGRGAAPRSGVRKRYPGDLRTTHWRPPAPARTCAPGRLDHKRFAGYCPLALLGSAFYPVLVHRLAASLHAYSPRSVALTQLRFASFAVTNAREGFHLKACARAGRTKTKPGKRLACSRVVETRRIELPTFALRTRRSPS